MKISKIITDKYKLRIPPTIFYDLLADVREVEEEQEPKTGHWISLGVQGEVDDQIVRVFTCSKCGAISIFRIASGNIVNGDICPNCDAKMIEPQESENT